MTHEEPPLVARRATRESSRSGARALAVLLCAAGCAATATATDDYLHAIMAEGERLEMLGKARQEEAQLQQRIERSRKLPPPAAAAGASKTLAHDTPTPSSRAQFEQKLLEEFPYSYSLYVRLTEQEKDEVYGAFRKGQNDGSARFLLALKKIIVFSTGRHDKR